MFQGLKKLRERNWNHPGFDPKTLDFLLLTHAYIDHAGNLPRLVKDGFRSPIYCTPATQSLPRLLLRDSARIQEEDAKYAIPVAEDAIEALILEAPRDGVILIGDIPWEGRKLQEGDNVWRGFVIMRLPDLSDHRASPPRGVRRGRETGRLPEARNVFRDRGGGARRIVTRPHRDRERARGR